MREAPATVGGAVSPARSRRLLAVMTAMALVLAALGGACGHPTDTSLVANFHAHRHTLDEIAQMAKADHRLTRVAIDFTWLDDNVAWPRADVGLTPDRWDQYRRLFKEAGVPEGYVRDAREGGLLMLFASTQGLVTGGSAKGYAYSETPLEPILQSLDDVPATPVKYWCGFVHLDGAWYLFLERD